MSPAGLDLTEGQLILVPESVFNAKDLSQGESRGQIVFSSTAKGRAFILRQKFTKRPTAGFLHRCTEVDLYDMTLSTYFQLKRLHCIYYYIAELHGGHGRCLPKDCED